LLEVRRDKRERAAFSAAQEREASAGNEDEEDDVYEAEMEHRFDMKQIAEPRKTQDSMTSDVCPRCGARVDTSGRSRTSIGEIVAGVVCTSLLLLLIVPTWRLTSQWLDQREQRVFDHLLWRGPVENWNE